MTSSLLADEVPGVFRSISTALGTIQTDRPRNFHWTVATHRSLFQTMRLTVNGHTYDVAAEPSATLLSVLREDLALTGTKLVCDRGECGACTVHLDGADARPEPAYACLTLAAACEGRKVTTIEGMGTSDAPHPLQEAFVRHDALQCGFCTPGQIMAAAALLARDPHPTEDVVVRWMSGNLCRCGAYPKIVRAVMDAAGRGAGA